MDKNIKGSQRSQLTGAASNNVIRNFYGSLLPLVFAINQLPLKAQRKRVCELYVEIPFSSVHQKSNSI